jgi:hypothetical protein
MTTTTVTLPAKTWTPAGTTDITGDQSFMNMGKAPIYAMGSTDATPPASFAGAHRYLSGQGDDRTMDKMWPGAGFVRLFFYSAVDGAVSVSHA